MANKKFKITKDDYRSVFFEVDEENNLVSPIEVNGKEVNVVDQSDIASIDVGVTDVSMSYNDDGELELKDQDDEVLDSIEVIANEVRAVTTAPTEDNDSGNYKLVVLSSEPATYYDGYIYIILGSA